jgi:ribosome-associated toxin RatA of RatAB toxin-antitoxin module
MPETRATRIIAAPPARVFESVAHIENFSKAVAGITNVEFLSESTTGVGTRVHRQLIQAAADVAFMRVGP